MALEIFLKENKILYQKGVALSQLTGMTLSGRLPILAKPKSVKELELLFRYVVKEKLSYIIIGNLTNTYLCDGFKRDIVIQTTSVRDIIWRDNEVDVGCGYSLTKLAREVSNKGFSGYEGFVGIPGTVGAATINNSGAFGNEMSMVVRFATVLDKCGNKHIVSNEMLAFKPRNSSLKGVFEGVLLSVTLEYSRPDNQQHILSRINQNLQYRKTYIDGKRKSLGSIFTGDSIIEVWKVHPLLNIIRKIIFAPFAHTRYRKKAQCISEFVALGKMKFIRQCDNIGRFCWTSDTKEQVFFEYIDFVQKISNNKVVLEIEIKR